jgi:hypothetical protein
MLMRSLLHLLNKLVEILDQTVKTKHNRLRFSAQSHKRLSVIKKILYQQNIRFQGGEVKKLIVSSERLSFKN